MSYFFPGLLFIASSVQIYECVTCLKVVFLLTKEQTYPVSALSNYGKMFKGKDASGHTLEPGLIERYLLKEHA